MDGLLPSKVSPLEIGEAHLPLLALAIKSAVDFIEHELEVQVHGALSALETGEVLVKEIGVQDRVV